LGEGLRNPNSHNACSYNTNYLNIHLPLPS
jgi:hypothetical protein